NTACGISALANNTADNNTATGANALNFNSTGIKNTADGNFALQFNTIGSQNTSVGYFSLHNTSASDGNTAVGYGAGYIFNNGYYNVFIGANTDVNGSDYYNVISIGQGTICTAPSQVTMGNSATNSYRAYANWSNISDGRYKKNMKEDVPGLQFINKLKPVTYTLNATAIDNFLHKNIPADKNLSAEGKAVMDKGFKEKEQIRYTGFVAQDVETAAKELNYDFSGVDAAKNENDLYGLRYAEFVVPLVKAVQELDQNQKVEVKIQNEKIAALQKQNELLQKQIDELKALLISQDSENKVDKKQTASNQ
ncbi:MAG: tail fiber domain-containing protein, partial [Parafilimonas sp.]